MKFLQLKNTDAEIIEPRFNSGSIFYSNESKKIKMFGKFTSYVTFTVSANTTIYEWLEDGTSTSHLLTTGINVVTPLTNAFSTDAKRVGTSYTNNAITKVDLTHYIFPDGGNPSFMCAGSKITSLDIPENITDLGKCICLQCGNLSAVTMSDNVTNIGSASFAYCYKLSNFTMPSKVTTIGYSAFLSCRPLTSITLPDTLTSIGAQAFQGCSGLTSVIVPDGVTVINQSTFGGCSSLTSATIGNYVTSMASYAFSSCSKLTSFHIPSTVTSIGIQAFNNCSKLQTLTFGGTMAQWNAITKGSNWKQNVPATVVTCTDGTVTL